MEKNYTPQTRSGWLRELVEGATNAFAFSRRGSTDDVRPRRSRWRAKNAFDSRARTADVHRLAALGFDRTEIARRTALAQDTVSLLLNLHSLEAAESAGHGTFFRLLETRVHD